MSIMHQLNSFEILLRMVSTKYERNLRSRIPLHSTDEKGKSQDDDQTSPALARRFKHRRKTGHKEVEEDRTIARVVTKARRKIAHEREPQRNAESGGTLRDGKSQQAEVVVQKDKKQTNDLRQARLTFQNSALSGAGGAGNKSGKSNGCEARRQREEQVMRSTRSLIVLF